MGGLGEQRRPGRVNKQRDCVTRAWRHGCKCLLEDQQDPRKVCFCLEIKRKQRGQWISEGHMHSQKLGIVGADGSSIFSV